MDTRDQLESIKFTKTFSKEIIYDGEKATIKANVRFDDECKNGHNTFAITGSIKIKGQRDFAVCGFIHGDIEKYFPELKKYIKWHLVSSDQPLHYAANTLYHAGNRDYNGKLKGEPFHFETKAKFKGFPISLDLKKEFTNHLQKNFVKGKVEIIEVPHEEKNLSTYNFKPKYSIKGFECEWYQCPFDDIREAEEFKEALETLDLEFISVPTSWGEGKEPDLDAARSSAIWPDATLEQLNDKKALEKHLSEIMPEFLQDMKELAQAE